MSMSTYKSDSVYFKQAILHNYGPFESRNSISFKRYRTVIAGSSGSNIPRWDDGEYYHIGGLSSAVIENFPKDKKRTSYKDWAKELFTDFPTDKPKLNDKVYLWVDLWESGQKGIWEEFAETPLPMQESMLIGLCDKISDDLLNTEGLVRPSN